MWHPFGAKSPQGLPAALIDQQAELSRLIDRMGTLERDWAIAIVKLDGTYDKVHRELGHITRKKRELIELTPCDEDSGNAARPGRRGIFAGGRRA